MKILLTGATGFVGRPLCRELLKQGHQLRILTRSKKESKDEAIKYYQWSHPEQTFPPLESLSNVDVIINLAGEPIAEGRWTKEKKKRIYNSRILITKNLISALENQRVKPQLLISTSAIGYYGPRGDEELNERSISGNDFLAKLCVDWESEALRAHTLGLKVAIVRVGLVLGAEGGLLKKLSPIFKLGLGGQLGNGQHWMSWIHQDDLVSLYSFLVHSHHDKIFNAVAPEPITNQEFTRVFAKILKRPAFFGVPAIAIKIVFGEMANMLLSSQKVRGDSLREVGFKFKYETLQQALCQEFENKE